MPHAIVSNALGVMRSSLAVPSGTALLPRRTSSARPKSFPFGIPAYSTIIGCRRDFTRAVRRYRPWRNVPARQEPDQTRTTLDFEVASRSALRSRRVGTWMMLTQIKHRARAHVEESRPRGRETRPPGGTGPRDVPPSDVAVPPDRPSEHNRTDSLLRKDDGARPRRGRRYR